MSHAAINDIKGELGPEFADLDLAALHPRRILADHLLGDDDSVEHQP
jgi:hypothetical protein